MSVCKIDPISFKILIFIGIEHRRFINTAVFKNRLSAADVIFGTGNHHPFQSYFFTVRQSISQHGSRISFSALGGTDGIADMPGIFFQIGIEIMPNLYHPDDFSVGFSDVNKLR